MEKARVLIVDDEWNMRNLIKIHLLREEAQIDEASDGFQAVELVEQNNYDLIILDVMMPKLDGWEVCAKIRETKQMPILMLTARTDIEDRVKGLNIGADDYLVKPFAPEELIARVNALLRRQQANQHQNINPIIKYPELEVDSVAREIRVNKDLLDFTSKEFDLFNYLINEPKRVFTRETLLYKIWDLSDYRDIRTVDTHIKNIREKLRKAGLSYNPIKTVWGVGYKFSSPDEQG